MKKQYIFTFLILMIFTNQITLGQYLQISAPVYQGVYQRDNSNNANVPVCGQVFGFPSTPGTYKIECITNRLNASGGVIPGTSSTTLITNNTVKGYFNGSITRPKGWYSLLMKFTFNATGYTSSTSTKFGVGDVFIVAGQSNGQGVNGSSFPTTAFPEWIVGTNEDWNCRKEFENIPLMTTLNGSNRIGPAGSNVWCYGVLGKKISDANGDMPVAFFNTCAAGSSVKNWREGAFGITTLGYQNGDQQWCNGYLPGQSSTYYLGQPYLTLKNTLNWFVSLFGVRAILWHQGEADAVNTSSNVVLSRTGTLYRDYLNEVITKSIQHSDISNLSWMIAKVSYSNENTSGGIICPNPADPNCNKLFSDNILNSQGTIPTGVVDNLGKKAGPTTDIYRSSYRVDNTHFSESNSSGLTTLANAWNGSGFIDNSASSLTTFNRISPKAVPPISISQSGSTYTFSISPVSGAIYCWAQQAAMIAPPVQDPVTGLLTGCLSISTSVVSGSGVRCFIGKPNGYSLGAAEYAVNWITTGVAGPQNCPGCREGEEEVDESYGGINMKLYPNPSDKDFRVEFDVPEDDTHVKLEFFDMIGNSVKVIADNSHAKGHFTYPIMGALPTGTLICQLKVGEIFITKKIMRVN
jgi:hypothetical protein